MKSKVQSPRRMRRPRVRPPVFEPLEIRALLSAALQITGNTHSILFNDTKPSVFDFTDFRQMSTTVDATIGTVSRTFVLGNSGDSALHFTGAFPIAISGPNAADFTVEAQPAATLDAGLTAGFTIDFKPKGVGTRTAKVTVASDDPAHPAFTFTIKGTGLKTTNNTSNHLETAVVKAGPLKSTGAVNGDKLLMDYTGFKLDGTVFDSSLFDSTDNRGHVPFEVSPLGTASVIQGWNLGLVGMKPGETRMLIIPSALAYGNDTNSGLDGQTLIFKVVRRKPPTLAVVGNGHAIVFGEAVPSAVDGTLLGTIGPGATNNSLSSTFQIVRADTVSGFNFTLSSAVTITGPQAADFKSSVISTGGGPLPAFTVTYHPLAPRTSTAVVHVHSSDGDHPDYSFTISASSTPFVDLTTSIGTINLPPNPVFSGAPTLYTIPVTVTNHGNIPIARTAAPIDVHVFLQPSLGGAPVEISSQHTTVLRGLGPGQSRTFMVTTDIPVHIGADTYGVRVDVDTVPTITEALYSNNSGFSAQGVVVQQGVYGLAGELGNSTFPASVASTASQAGQLAVQITNTSNITLPAGQEITIQLVAINTGDASQTVLSAPLSFSVAGWTAGRVGTFNVAGTIPTGMTAGSYQLAAIITPTPDLADFDVFTVTLNGSAAVIPLTVT